MTKNCKDACESCLMPFSKDPGVRENEKYCSYCFKNGKFTYEGDLKGFQKFVYKGMLGVGVPKLKAKFYTWMVRFAPRWQNKK